MVSSSLYSSLPEEEPRESPGSLDLPLPSRADENERLEVLRSCEILDTEDEQFFDDVAFLARTICGKPIALVSLVAEHRQWFKSRLGLDARETSRESSFCAHAIREDNAIFEVEDALADSRFAGNPLVLGEPHIRFYAGAPIVVSGRAAVGTVCVIDREPGRLNAQQAASLASLARQVAHELEQRAASAAQRQQKNSPAAP